MGSLYRDAKLHPGKDVRRRGAASNEGRTAGGHATIWSLGSAQPELDNRMTIGGCADSRCFRSDERLEINDVQQSGLDELTLQQRAADSQQWLVRK